MVAGPVATSTCTHEAAARLLARGPDQPRPRLRSLGGEWRPHVDDILAMGPGVRHQSSCLGRVGQRVDNRIAVQLAGFTSRKR